MSRGAPYAAAHRVGTCSVRSLSAILHAPVVLVRALCVALLLSTACQPELEKLESKRSPRGTLGEEAYKLVCRRIAGTEIPADLEGRESEVLCLGDAEEVVEELEARREELSERAPRLLAFAERRAQVAEAVDATFPDDLGDQLEHLMRELLPFYDPPEEQIQNNTRAFAALLRAMSENDAALAGLARVAREGMLPAEGNFGLYRAALAYDQLQQLFTALLPRITDDAATKSHFQALLTGLALELATSELDDAPDSDTRRLKDLLARTRPEFGAGAPLWVAERDVRGMPVPTPRGDVQVPFPFVDEDGDGLADIEGEEFVVDENFQGELPEPFPELSEPGVARDIHGRAYAFTEDGEVDSTRLLYQTVDVDARLLAGLLREAAGLFGEDTQIAVQLAKLSSALFGERVDLTRRYGEGRYTYAAPDSAKSPLVDLAHAGTAMVDHPLYDQSLALTQRLLDEEEPLLVEALEPLLALESRTRSGSDAYAEAQLPSDSLFWDELLFEVERVVRRRKTQAGPTLLELLLRGALGYARNLDKPDAPLEQLVDPQVLRHQGALASVLMRFKDEWRNNPKGESERAPGEPAIVGGFRIPVDRSKPNHDTPVTCGKDGCGGQVKGTPFERWAKPGQNCVLQREGRPASGKDCGAPANQSILQRSLGLVWEMAGRSLCNKPITLANLLDAVLEDPCAELVDDQEQPYPCTVDADCVAELGSSDYACDTARGQCIASPATTTCQLLKQQQRQERQDAVMEGEPKLANDYACPADKPDAACHAYSDTYPAAFVDADGPASGEPSTLLACHLLNLADVGRSFGRALTHEFTIDIPNPWVRRYLEDIARAGDMSIPECAEAFDIVDPLQVPPCITASARLSRDTYDNMPDGVDTLGELIEFLLDDTSLFPTPEDEQELRPDVRALTRVLFAPPGSTAFVTLDPLLVHSAPKACSEAPGLPACLQDDTAPTPQGGCCIEDLSRPPFRYRLETYYGSVSFAWEHPVQFTDGTSLSLLDAMKTLADAVNQTDFDPETDDPKDFEGTDFLFSTLGKLVGQHYDSQGNSLAQNADPNGPHYRSFSNLVSYERLLADALDDGTLDRAQVGPHGEPLFDEATLPKGKEQQLGLVYHSYPLLERMAELEFDAGDGIHLSAAIAELLLSAHAYCAPEGGDLRVIDGRGACHAAAEGAAGYRKPLTYRDGRAAICWNDGRCFESDEDRRYPSPLYLLLDAIGEVDRRLAQSPEREAAWGRVRGGLFDTYFGTTDGKLADRRLRALLSVGLGYMRERWAEEAQTGGLATFGARSTADAVELVEHPALAGGLGLLEELGKQPEVMDALNRFLGAMLGQGADDVQLRALALMLADALEVLPGDENLMALTRAMALGIVPNVADWVRDGEGEPALEEGLIWRSLVLLKESVAEDTEGVFGKVLRNAVTLPEEGRATPFSALAEALLAINREQPGARESMTAADWKAASARIADVMLDERRGFERLYQIVQCRNGSTEELSCE